MSSRYVFFLDYFSLCNCFKSRRLISDSSLTSLQIVGLIVGSIIVVVLIGFGVFLYIRRSNVFRNGSQDEEQAKEVKLPVINKASGKEGSFINIRGARQTVTSIRVMEKITEAARSVGHLNVSIGTTHCFLVSQNKIMTAGHVAKSRLENSTYRYLSLLLDF